MHERVIKLLSWLKAALPDVRLMLADMGVSFFSMITVQQIYVDIVHTAIAVTGTLVGGSFLFVLQKTILPRISNWFNEKIDSWFDKDTLE